MPGKAPYRNRRSRRPGPAFHGHTDPSPQGGAAAPTIVGALLILQQLIELTFSDTVTTPGGDWSSLVVHAPSGDAFGTTATQTGPTTLEIDLNDFIDGGDGTYELTGDTGILFTAGSLALPASGPYTQDF